MANRRNNQGKASSVKTSHEYTTDWEAYEKGSQAWDKYLHNNIKPQNPYKRGTNKWYSWRKGWNTNFNGI